MLVLALDIGTSSCRSALFDGRGVRHLATTAQQSYQLHTDRDGRAEIDPPTLLAAVTGCISRTLTAQAKDRRLRAREVVAVGTSCFWHSLVGCNAGGAPLTPVLTWADSRCRDDAERLRKNLDEHTTHARTGCMLRASFWPAKLRWLARTAPQLARTVACWMSPGEWLYLQLCGQRRCAHGMATGTGLYDPAALGWDAGMLRAAGVARAQLSPLGDQPLCLLPRFQARFPALRTALWYPAIGDGAASNLGSGATRPGLAAINFGTSAAVRVMNRAPAGKSARAPFGLFCYRVDEERTLIGGAISNAGNLRAWCLRELKLDADEERIERALSERPAPDHGLDVLPFWSAERSPTWREDVAGAVVGIHHATTALDLLQAITEASYHRLATIINLVIGGARPPRFIVGGGIQRSPASLQRLADVLGHPLTALDEAEASLRGAAVFALEKLGRGAALGQVTGRTVRPRAGLARRYAASRQALALLEATLFPPSARTPAARSR